jgi:hypothetical protein
VDENFVVEFGLIWKNAANCLLISHKNRSGPRFIKNSSRKSFLHLWKTPISALQSNSICIFSGMRHPLAIAFVFFLVGTFWIPDLSAQVDTILVDDLGTFIEDILQNTDEEIEDFDFNTLYERLSYLQEHPIDLNRASREDLQELVFLSDLQIDRFLGYREQAGPLVTIYELQAVPGLDLATIRQLLPFVSLRSELDDYQEPLGKMLLEGRNELYLRWSRFLEPQRGFLLADDTTSRSRFLGDPNQFYIRFKHSSSNRLSYGFTAEKDIGEEFFSGSNPAGFDFYSGHFFLRNFNRRIKALAIGDYSVNFGQGLILFTGFGYGKSSATMDVLRSGPTLRPFTSVNEAAFFRGAATTLALGDQLEWTLFGSARRRDGNIIEADTTGPSGSLQALSSILISGLHRTPAEVEDEGALEQYTAGTRLAWKGNRFSLGGNLVVDRLDKTIDRRDQLYQRYAFEGNQLLNASIDYTYRWQNIRFFGETAMSDNWQLATLNGLLLGLDRKVDLSILYRNFTPGFQTFNGNAFGETTGVSNEEGLYLGTEIRPQNNWRINAFFDWWRHPWLRFRADAPSRGYDWLFRITHFKKRTYEFYWQIRGEEKERNQPDNTGKTDQIVPQQLLLSRWQFSYNVNKALTLRTRLSLGTARPDPNLPRETGVLLYQDILYRPIGFPLSFTGRLALYDTDSYNVRFYAFENDLLYTFSIPAYFGRGSRYYLNLRYKGIRNLTMEFRVAQSFFRDRLEIGSGPNEVAGPRRTQFRAQMRYVF